MTTASEISWADLKTMIFGLAEQSRETDRLIKELRDSGKETDRQMQETDRRMHETDRRIHETDRMIKELGKQIGGLGDKFGYFTEGMALPTMERLLETRFGMETINPRAKSRRGGKEQEYDVLSWANGEVNTAIVVEIKSRVKKEAIAQLIGQLETLFDFWPEITGKKRVGILTGVDWDPGVAEEAQQAGLFTACIHDDIFELTTPTAFTPRYW